MARRSTINRVGHPVTPQPYGNISYNPNGTWNVSVPRPKKSGGFRPKPPSDNTIRERAVVARHESRSNTCKRCFTVRSLATGECMC